MALLKDPMSTEVVPGVLLVEEVVVTKDVLKVISVVLIIFQEVLVFVCGWVVSGGSSVRL